MHYFIDGYNLMFHLDSNAEQFTATRQRLIKELSEKIDLLKLNVTVVFDAQHQENELSRSHLRNVEIVYSSRGETADDCILQFIHQEKDPRKVTVVTSDRKLAWFARRCEAKTETIAQFLQWFEKRVHNRVKSVKASVKTKRKAVSADQYYLEEFKKRMPEQIQKKAPETDFERWERIFQERLGE